MPSQLNHYLADNNLLRRGNAMTIKEHIDASAIGARLCEAGVRGIVLGFPKSGTTAFAQWLDGSPRVDISNPKETFQLCPEYATNLNRSAQVPLGDSFHGQVEAQLRVEATTLNVYSESLRSAAAELPELKVIMLMKSRLERYLTRMTSCQYSSARSPATKYSGICPE